jgi:hypothetical protein
MDSTVPDAHLENIDRRLTKLEQILPTLATKNDLKALATNDDLKALATKVEACATKEDLRAESERLRLDMRILIEHQDSKLELLAEHVLSLRPKPLNE